MPPARLTLIGGAILVASAFVLLPGSPPLYDSLRIPDQPYRTLTAGPQPASARVEVTPADPVINLTTDERRPQAYLLVQTGSLRLVAGTTRIVGSLVAVPVPSPGPRDGVPLGNAYEVTVHDQSGAPLEPGRMGERPVVQLRIPTVSTPGHVVLELHDHGAWSVLRTIRTADVIYAAELPAFGVVVAVYRLSSTVPPVTAGARGIDVVWLIVATGVVLLVVVAALIAVGRGRREPRGAAHP